VANGGRLPNRGVRRVETQHGVFRFGLADVTKPLLSVGDIVAKGHDVLMRADGGYIVVRKNGKIVRRVPLKLQKGVFTLELKQRPGSGTVLKQPPARQGTNTWNRFSALSPVDEEDESVEATPFQWQAQEL